MTWWGSLVRVQSRLPIPLPHPFFTIGHSNRTLDELIGLVAANAIATIVDVRRFPGSRAQPQFNAEALAAALARHGIGYELMEALGGRRVRSKDIPPEVNGFWENQSFHNYADYAMTPQFRAALDELIAIGREKRCAIMCSEAVWWRCHRRIVSDYLLAGGVAVEHIMGPGKVEPARLTPGARPQPDGTILYASEVTGSLL